VEAIAEQRLPSAGGGMNTAALISNAPTKLLLLYNYSARFIAWPLHLPFPIFLLCDPGHKKTFYFFTVLQIRDVYPDPDFFHLGSRIKQPKKDGIFVVLPFFGHINFTKL
jgi:hypothetical protein